MWLYRKMLKDLGILGENSYRKKIRSKVVQLNDMENVVAQGIVDPTSIGVSLSQVGGLEKVKKVMEESVVIPLSSPELYPPGSLRAPPKGVLLHGPPGTGKTLLARAIAKEANATFIEVKLDSLLTKWVGDSEKHVAAIFSLARKLQPSIVFVDEIDGLLCDRDAGSSSSPTFNLVKTIFMTEWDGLTSSNSTIVVIGATNRPGAIDEAVLRRMPVKQKVSYPDESARHQIIKIILENDKTISRSSLQQLDINRIASNCEGYSGSDLHELCKEAALEAVRCSEASSPLLRINDSHFHRALTIIGDNQSFVKSYNPASRMGLFSSRT